MINQLTFLEEGKYSGRDKIVETIANDFKKSTTSLRRAISEYVTRELKYDDSQKEKLFRKRTGSQILESGFVTGCTDVALSFVVLARELEIPTRFVDTFYEPWLNFNPSEKNLRNADAFRKQFSNYLKDMDHKLTNNSISEKNATEQVYNKWINFCDDSTVPIEQIERLIRYNGNGIDGHVFVDILVDGKWMPYEPKRGFIQQEGYFLNRGKYVEIGKGLDFSAVYIKENGIYRPEPTNLQNLQDAVELFKPKIKKR